LGIDEAGRGPLAGPVVAAAVAIKDFDFASEVRDSKLLSPRQREKAFAEIFTKAHVGVGVIAESAIDEINILEATFVAMTNAVWHLLRRVPPEFRSGDWTKKVLLLVDGNRFKTELPYHFQTLVSGDARSLSIACASVVAKVTRDRILMAYDKIYPQYGFKKHKGYPTAEHRNAIERHGFSPIHRLTFRVLHDEKKQDYAGSPG